MSRMLRIVDPFDEIKRIYFSTTRETIEADLRHALDLLKQMSSDDERQRAAGLMHGLADLRREWKPRPRPKTSKAGHAGAKARPKARRPKPDR
jgi:hypothetical protein